MMTKRCVMCPGDTGDILPRLTTIDKYLFSIFPASAAVNLQPQISSYKARP